MHKIFKKQPPKAITNTPADSSAINQKKRDLIDIPRNAEDGPQVLHTNSLPSRKDRRYKEPKNAGAQNNRSHPKKRNKVFLKMSKLFFDIENMKYGLAYNSKKKPSTEEKAAA